MSDQSGREATRLAELGPKWHETCRQSHVIGTPCVTPPDAPGSTAIKTPPARET